MFNLHHTKAHKCVYFDCPNRKRVDSSLSFFKFPVGKKDMLAQWIKNCANDGIASLAPDELRNKVICEEHFHLKDIITCRNRKLLQRMAVPIKYSGTTTDAYPESSVIIPTRTYKGPSPEFKKPAAELSSSINDDAASTEEEQEEIQELIDQPCPTKTYMAKIQLLTEQVKQMRRKVILHQRQNIRLKNKLKYSSDECVINRLLSDKSHSVKTFVKMQLFHDNTYTDEEKDLCESIYYASPKCYKTLLDLDFVLPSIRTMQR